MAIDIFYILIFPGFLFLSVFGLFAEFIDRKIYARLQSRIGPPWYQPLADFIKLLGKEDIVPCDANPAMFKLMPLIAATATVTAFMYIPLWDHKSLYSFNGDIVVILYLLTIPTLTFFIGGWYSTSLYARIGSVRAITQMFAYEVPLLMGIFAPALLADSWSLSEISIFYAKHPSYCLLNILGLAVSMVAILGKLEKAPFDIPEAETEIVAGAFTEYSGRLFAFFKLTVDMELISCAALLSVIFLPFGLDLNPVVSFSLSILKILLIVSILALMRTVVARLRIDQMVKFCWKYLAPAAMIQLLVNLILKRILPI